MTATTSACWHYPRTPAQSGAATPRFARAATQPWALSPAEKKGPMGGLSPSSVKSTRTSRTKSLKIQRVSATSDRLSQRVQQFGFTGYKLDAETALYAARNRMYSAKLGRFISRDPIGYVDGMSNYDGYFAGNGVDPYGLFKCAWVVVLSHVGDADFPLNGGTKPEDGCSRYDSISCRNKKAIYGKYVATPSPHSALVGDSSSPGRNDVETGSTLVTDGLVRGMANDKAGEASRKAGSAQVENYRRRLNTMREELYNKAIKNDCCDCPNLDFYFIGISPEARKVLAALHVGEGIRSPGGNSVTVPGNQREYDKWSTGSWNDDKGWNPRPATQDINSSAPAVGELIDSWRDSFGDEKIDDLDMTWIHETYPCTAGTSSRPPFQPW